MKTDSFFDYLEENDLHYSLETVENFLLSIKAKQFLILSGPSGTGKTRLALNYAEYLNSDSNTRREVTLKTAIAKDRTMLSINNPKDFYRAFPRFKPSGQEFEIKLGNLTTNAEINIVPRIHVKGSTVKDVGTELDRLRNDKDNPPHYNGDKPFTEFTLFFPEERGESFVVVPVGANWTESRHILGYKNPITNEYVQTPALTILEAAQAAPYHTFILILDEMNLSHVERYFSDILSAMESGEPILIDKEDNNLITIGPNLIIIGTVNQDETTYSFSPKVLDRANVIEFPQSDIHEVFSGNVNQDKPTGDVEFLVNPDNRAEICNKTSREIIEEMRKSNKNNVELLERMDSCLSSIQEILSPMGFAIGYRTIDEVMRFMYAAWLYEHKDLSAKFSRYLDAQIIQKILPKIHGNLSILNGLEKIKSILEKNELPESKKKTEKMIEILKNQRYVSFNC